MEIQPTAIPGVFVVSPPVRGDARGSFVKPFARSTFEAAGLDCDWDEHYVSRSAPGVVRGMHFQAPPHDHPKLVTCVDGAIFDVAVDLRTGSTTFGSHVSVELSADNGRALYLPRGIAHGFCTPAGSATVVYLVGSEYAPTHDLGVRWDSVGVDWPVDSPVTSERDANFPTLGEYDSPF